MNKTELVLNPDGTIYHLKLKPGDVAETIFLVGDPARAEVISGFFNTIELHQTNREINTYTGTYKNKRFTVLSTGMGTDNIEIVVNELDALFNIDFGTRHSKNKITALNLIRIGTSGGLHKEITFDDSYVVSRYGLGLDGLAYFYKNSGLAMEKELTASFINQMDWDDNLPKPYAVEASDQLVEKLSSGWRKGITLTAPGFYAPQGRELRLKVTDNTIIDRASNFKYNGYQVTNFEMETSALYLLSKMLGHRAITVCDIIANRITGEFNHNYQLSMKNLISEMMERALKL
jgi:uridine phosphorylase